MSSSLRKTQFPPKSGEQGGQETGKYEMRT